MKWVAKYSRPGLGETKLKCKMNAHEKHCTHWKVKVKTMVSEINVVAVDPKLNNEHCANVKSRGKKYTNMKLWGMSCSCVHVIKVEKAMELNQGKSDPVAN